MEPISVGSGSQIAIFSHPNPLVGELHVYTGLDRVSWGYNLNVQRYPTYGGEVVQILSCYVDDLTVEGTLTSYKDLEQTYTFFMTYMQLASTEGKRDENPMVFRYPHRGWEFKIIPTSAPGYRKSRDLTVPNWRITAHIVDESNDVAELSELIMNEAQFKAEVGQDENFGLQGKIRFVDENPFSDPWTDHGTRFDPTEHMDKITDYYSTLLPAYLDGDFDTIFGGMGSGPAFNPDRGPKGATDDAYAGPIVKKIEAVPGRPSVTQAPGSNGESRPG